MGLRLGVDLMDTYITRFGLKEKTGIDLPGEAGMIMHKKENMGPVELATVSFGQSFQVTPIRLIATVSMIINGGNQITPHLAKAVGEQSLVYPKESGIISKDTSDKMKGILEKVVSEGSGKNAYIEGYEIGGKTATSQTLPRSNGKYISSFLGFAPADDPQVIALVIVNVPKNGAYYGSVVAAPVARKLFDNILPYMEDRIFTND